MRSASLLVTLCIAGLLVAPAGASAGGFYASAVGARAGAMGGAFIGLADDYSAVYWNPAGATRIEGAQLTVTGADFLPLASREGWISFEGADIGGARVASEIQATSDVKHFFAPGAFLYVDPGPARVLFDKIGVCFYTLADHGVFWDGSEVYDDIIEAYGTDPSYEEGYRQVMGDPPDFQSRVTGYSVSPVFAKDFGPSFSLGVAGNFVYGRFEYMTGSWHEETFEDSSRLHPYQFEEDLKGWAYGATVGAMYRVSDDVSIGAVVRTPMTFSLEGDVAVSSTWEDYVSPSQTEDFELTFPLWAGAGLAYRNFLADGLTMTADIDYTQWSAVDEIVRTTDEELPLGLGTTTLDWEDAIGFGVGFDYRLSQAASLRLGYHSSPSQTPDETFDFALPQTAHDIVTLGFGYRSKAWLADVSLEYAAGQSVELGFGPDTETLGDNLHDVIVPTLSFTYFF